MTDEEVRQYKIKYHEEIVEEADKEIIINKLKIQELQEKIEYYEIRKSRSIKVLDKMRGV